ncbi:MAG: anthranilate synthase component I family protein, partial [Candidatus Poribacteria bacterium]|nr:anthranilate synthase component I family protein [Candidatus Poribacteria bacterium]
TEDDLDLPDSFFMLTDTILVFDHVSHQIKVVANAHVEGDVDAAYETATSQIDELITKLKQPLKPESGLVTQDIQPEEVKSNFIKVDYEKIIDLAKEYIGAGDIIQVVPSQRFSTPISVEVFEVYRALRMINPSPYMYYLKLGDNLKIAGASPEMMVRVEDGMAETCPIAGTKPRGQTPEEDEALARELIEDPKELAEHVMLVDLGRNDLGRVCEYNTVRVSKMMAIERYSHVMHIVSQVEGKLRQGMSAFDVIRACFPAGTLSGAPKIRAMEIIDELERTRRGCYGGAVGYFSFDGNSDTAITIRTIIVKDGIAYVQAGGGIVADSVNETEFQETVNKARTVIRAVELAELGLE